MTDLPETDPNDRTICFCHYVSAKEIIEAIQTGSRTLEDIQADTLASTGCGGCQVDVLEILRAELEKSSRN